MLPGFGSAEILHGIYPLDDLAAVKKKFPNARFTKLAPAWLKEDQAMLKMVGDGFPGELILVFADDRPMFKQWVSANCNDPVQQSAESTCTSRKRLALQSDDDALTISWVRWVPVQPIPFERYRSKYGEPSKMDFDNDMVPTAEWESVALSAQLSDDKKFVQFVTTAFTRSEQRVAWLRVFNFVPEYLKDSSSEPSPSRPPKGKLQKQL